MQFIRKFKNSLKRTNKPHGSPRKARGTAQLWVVTRYSVFKYRFASYFAYSAMKRMRMVATCARLAVDFGLSLFALP